MPWFLDSRALTASGAQPSANATLPPFPLMRPDAVLGLDPLKVPVSVGVDATPLVPPGIKAGLYAASIPRLQTSLCDCESQEIALGHTQ